jgi:DNA-binding NarL/FixJ family response regulator
MRSLVLIADDVAVTQRVRAALRYAAALRLTATLDARGAVGDEIARLAPDVVLVAEACQRMNTLRRLREARQAAPAATLLVLGCPGSGGSSDDAFRAGADAILAAAADPAALGTLLGQIGLGHLVLAAPRPEPELPAVEDGPPPLRLARTAQDARGTRANA